MYVDATTINNNYSPGSLTRRCCFHVQVGMRCGQAGGGEGTGQQAKILLS